jgi:hypothetical protein
MSIERRTYRRTPWRTADDLLAAALVQARFAYEFAPGSYTFGTMSAVMNAIARLRAPDWIAEFIKYENLGASAFVAGPLEGTPGNLPTECVKQDESGSPRNRPANRRRQNCLPGSGRQSGFSGLRVPHNTRT